MSKPGIDLVASLPGGEIWVAECKGEPTPKGIKSGEDRTAFYAGLGQLIISSDIPGTPSPNVMLLGVPNTDRFRSLAQEASRNRLVRRLGINLVLVDSEGHVTEI